MKRVAVLVCLLFLVGCEGAAVQEVSSRVEKPVVRVWVNGGAAVFERAAASFTAADIRVYDTDTDEEDAVVLRAMMAGENPPDLVLCDQAALSVMRPFAENRMHEAWVVRADAILLEPVRDGGVLCAMPAEVVGYGLLYREKALEALGVAAENVNSFVRLQEVAARFEGVAVGISQEALAAVLPTIFRESEEAFREMMVFLKERGRVMDDPLAAAERGEVLFALAACARSDGAFSVLPLPSPDGARGNVVAEVVRFWVINRHSARAVREAAGAFSEAVSGAAIGEADGAVGAFLKSGRVVLSEAGRLTAKERAALGKRLAAFLAGEEELGGCEALLRELFAEN